MTKKKMKKLRGPHSQPHLILCDWCGVQRRTSRTDTSTCSGRCRQRMAAFVNHCGYRPEVMPGHVTAREAIAAEIGMLLRQEARRRATV